MTCRLCTPAGLSMILLHRYFTLKCPAVGIILGLVPWEMLLFPLQRSWYSCCIYCSRPGRVARVHLNVKPAPPRKLIWVAADHSDFSALESISPKHRERWCCPVRYLTPGNKPVVGRHCARKRKITKPASLLRKHLSQKFNLFPIFYPTPPP